MIKFIKAANWQCRKCMTTFAIKYNLETPEEEVLNQLLDLHKKKQMDCTSPTGFKQTDLFVKQDETK